MTVVFTDDFTKADGPLDSSKWSVLGTNASQTLAVNSNRALATVTNTTTAYVRAYALFQNRADNELLILINRSATSTAPVWSVGINGSGTERTFGTTAGYSFNNAYRVHAKHGAPVFEKVSGGTRTTLGTFAIPAAGNHWIRLQKSGSVIQVKMWGEFSPEPTAWNFTYTDAAPLAAGDVFFAAHSGGAGSTKFFDSVTIDDMAVVNPVDVTVLETPAEASAFAVDPVVTATASFPVTVTVTPAVATATLVDPVVTTARSNTVAAPVLTASATAPNATVTGSTNYATDFGEYALGVPVGWTKRMGTTFAIEESAASYSGKWFYGPALSNSSLYTYNGMNATVNGDVLVRTYGSGGVVYNYVSNTNYKVIGFDSTTSLYAGGSAGTTQSVPASLSTTFNWLRVRVAAGRVQARAWKNGATEPSTWDIDFANATLAPAMWGHFAFTNKASAMDYFALNTNEGGVAAAYSRGKEIDAVALTATATIVEPAVTVGTTREVVAAPALASAALVEPVVEGADTITFAVGAATATADMPGGTAVSPDVTNTPSPAEATAAMPEAVAYAGHDEVVTVGVAEASAEMTEPTFSNVTEVNIAAEPMQATARLPYYTEADDPWIQTITSALPALAMADAYGSLPVWMRFGQETFGPLKNYAKTAFPEYGSWSGVPEFGVRDEANRKATHFDGDSYALTSLPPGTDPSPLTWEIVFRTTDTNGPLISSEVEDPVSTFGQELFTGLEIKDGRLTTISRDIRYNSSFIPYTFEDKSYTVPGAAVNDGVWHHVMVTFGSRGLEVFIDGVSRFIRRPQFGGQSIMNVQPAERIGTNSTASEFFVGDIVAFVQYPYQLAREAGNRHYYDYVLATVVRAGALTASADMPAGKGRGNKLRALAMYVNGGEVHAYGVGDPNWTGIRIGGSSGLTGGIREFTNEPFEHGPYTVFPRRMTQTRSEYDFSLGLSNMDDVADLADYDMFFFIDHWKPNNIVDDRELTGTFVNLQPAYEEFIASVRRAIDTGISFWCAQPQLAADLGFIDALDVHSFQQQAYDAKSFIEDDPVWKSRLNAKKEEYQDTHYNNKYRVTAQLEGFTDLEGRIIDDVVYWQNPNQFNIRPDYAKWNAKELPDGLHVGDTVYMPTPLAVNLAGATGHPDYVRHQIWSVPAGKYAGTAVAKELATVNMNDNRDVANPYVNNALTIAIQPGDNVRGRPIGGKVLVDFMSGYVINPFVEAQTYAEKQIVYVQVPPFGTPDQPTLDDFDGFDFDGRRMNAFFEMRVTVVTTEVTGPGGSKNITQEIEVPIFDETNKYPVMVYRQYPWLERALNWLGIKAEVGEGGVRVLAARSEASAAMPSAGVTVQKHNTVSAGSPAQALATIIKPQGIIDPDVTVTTLPMTAEARMLNRATVVAPTPMTADAEMGEATIRATGQDYVLSIKSFTTATVYLKEDAV